MHNPRIGPSLAVAFLLAASPGFAHEFILKPAAATVPAGQTLPFTLVSSHVFMTSEELEDPNDTKAALISGGSKTAIGVKPNAPKLVFEGSVAAPTDKTFILWGNRGGQVWSSTAQGTKRVAKGTPGASNSRMIEKFSKTLINVAAGDDGYRVVVGDRLEIVPITNPAGVKPGEEIAVRILFDGTPVSTPVYATYDGFSNEENTYAYYTEAKSDGTAKVKITQPGLWMARVEYSTPDPAPTHDRYLARSTLVFEIK